MFGRKKPGIEILPKLMEGATAFHVNLNSLHDNNTLDDSDWAEGLIVFGHFCIRVMASDGKVSKPEMELLAGYFKMLELTDSQIRTIIDGSVEYRIPIDGSPLFFDKSIEWDRLNGSRRSEFMVRGLVAAMLSFAGADGKIAKKEIQQVIDLVDPLQRARVRGGLARVDF